MQNLPEPTETSKRIDAVVKQARADHKDAGGHDALVIDLLALSASIDDYNPADLTEPGCDEPTIDCRLRYHDGAFSFLTGSSDYDQDHRGSWGASCVGPNLLSDDALGIAIDLLDQVLDDLAQSIA